MVARIQSSLYTGMVEGEGISDIMRRLRDTMGVSTDRSMFIRGGVLNKQLRANFNTIQTLTRTVVNKASNDGAIALYRQNPDVVTGYTWITARDERVCATCRSLNGTQYRLNDSFRPPAHPNCRCAIIPDVSADWSQIPADAAPQSTFVDFLIGFGVGWLIGEQV
jgi:SPP1 gp7 family putative phage head morphogenesis protein